METNPRIFLSHSHRDRHFATELQDVLDTNGAKTYLDQDKIQAGDILPERIQDGISWGDKLLLIWSTNAAGSSWVEVEWNTAYDLRKPIIPYSLDRTPLPALLKHIVRVEANDREHGDANLLKAVFGEGFIPDPTKLYPGNWHASVDAFGMAHGTYDLKLRANGQVEGKGGMGQGGFAGDLARSLDAGGLLSMKVPVQGNWSYDRGTQILTLTITASGFGQQNTDVVRIRTTGKERGEIQGEDLAGRTWSLRRVGKREGSRTDNSKQQVRKRFRGTPEELYGKGIALWEGSGYSDPNLAVKYFAQAIHLDPNNANTHHALGLAHHQLRNYAEALEDFSNAINLYPDDSEYYNARGSTYHAMKNRNKARKDWKIACSMGNSRGCENLRRF